MRYCIQIYDTILVLITDEITRRDVKTLGMCLSLIGGKISEEMVVQFEDSLLMKEPPEEAVRLLVEYLFFNTRYCSESGSTSLFKCMTTPFFK